MSGALNFDWLRERLLEVINTTPDPSPIGVMELRANEGGHDTEYVCLLLNGSRNPWA